jgi:DNA-binding protein HU-beta
MLKSDLVLKVHTALGEGMDKARAQAAVDAVFAEIAKGLKADGEVRIAGFGIFKKKNRPARMGPKPGSPGERIQYAASTNVTFRAGKELKVTVQ